MKGISDARWLPLALGLFLAPLIGGKLSVDTQPLAPDTSPWTAALSGSVETPLLSHALIALCCLASMGLALGLRRVVPLPTPRLLAPLGGFLLVAAVTLVFSQYRPVSLAVWLGWAAAVMVLPTVVATAGREHGPRILAAALVAGCTVVALKGVMEYGQMRSIDPTWRIFAGWMNQNALGGMLILGFFPACGLALTSTRLGTLLASLAASLIGIALVLSQSRGSFLALAVGLVVLVVAAIRLGRGRALRLVIPAVAVALFVVALQATPPATPGATGGVLSRVADSQATQTQSAGFRLQLWRTAVALVQQNPAGSGPGTFRFRSPSPGLVTSTVLAHNTYLQIAAEASPLALILFLLALAVWAREVIPGAKDEPVDRAILRWAAIAGVTAALAHNVVDSDLYHFGFAVGLFGLMGLALMWSRDAMAPELLTPGLRYGGVVAIAVLLPFAMIRFGLDEVTKAQFLGAVSVGQRAEVSPGLRRLAERDGEAAYLLALYGPGASDPAERLALLQDSAVLAPIPRTFRALATAQSEQGNFAAAEDALRRALTLDPNNLPALNQLMNLALSREDEPGLQAAASRAVEVESRPVFQIRAIPELVPTTTYRARYLLALRVADPEAQVELLRPALAGLLQYRAQTLPRVRQAASVQPPTSFGGESPDDAAEAMRLGMDVASRLAEAYRRLDQSDDAASARLEATRFGDAAREATSPLLPGGSTGDSTI